MLVLGKMYDDQNRRHLAGLILELASGNHKRLMTDYFNILFAKNGAPDGMRMSVYCADQTVYHSEKVREGLNKVYPYLKGFHINDVYQELCDCWKVPPVNANTKLPYYSTVPILLADGEMDPACRPMYIDRIAHYMPNNQKFLLVNKGHGVIGRSMTEIIRSFLAKPYQKITPNDPAIIAY